MRACVENGTAAAFGLTATAPSAGRVECVLTLLAAMVTRSEAHPVFTIQLKSDSSASYRHDLRFRVHDALARGDRQVAVECDNWTELDLVLLATLVYCADQCRREGAEFELVNVREDMRRRIVALSLAERLYLR